MTALLFIVVSVVHAQQRTVSGVVMSAANESPLPGVLVVVSGAAGTGTITDTDGSYSIQVPDGTQSLVFSLLGMETQTREVGSSNIIDVAMTESSETLDEVVVVGYTARRRSQISSSVATVSAGELNDVTSKNIGSLLQGKASGVFVENPSGNPNVQSNVTIRGSSSISAKAAPLYVVDGIVGGTANPSDVKSVTILKDAAATGLYGSRAANGVIIIETNSGQAGKTKVTFNATVGMSQLDLGNYELMGTSELYDFHKTFVPADAFTQLRPSSLLSQQTDWMDLAYHTGSVQDYLLSVSGGSEKTQFYVSGNYYRETGIMRNVSNELFNTRMNLNHKINDKLRLQVKFNARSRTYENEASGGYGALAAMNYMPWDNPYNADGSIKKGTESEWTYRYAESFLHGWQYNFDKGRALNVDGDVNLTYNILDNLSISTYNRGTFNNRKADVYYDSRSVAGRGIGELRNSFYFDRTLLSSNRVNFDKEFGKSRLNAIGVFEVERNYHDQNSQIGEGFAPGIYIMEAAATVKKYAERRGNEGNTDPGSAWDNIFVKGLVQAEYSYNNRYFLVGSYIREGSSRFGQNNRFANFFTLGGSWLITNERFMQQQNLLDMLKLRASYGVTGNADIGNYQALGLYSLSGQYAGNPAATPSQLGNRDLTWERISTFNLGLDISMLKERIRMNIDWYDKTSHDLLLSVPKPYTSGYSSRMENIGSVRNRGFELTINSVNIDTRSFRWETNFNIAFNRNKVMGLYGGADLTNGNFRLKEGGDMYNWYLRKWAGVDPETGDPQWEQVTEDGQGNKSVTLVNNYSDATLQYLDMTASPDFTGGLGNNFYYKGFSLRVFFNYVYGNTIWGTTPSDGQEMNQNVRRLQKGEVRWEKAGDRATEPKAVLGGNNGSNQDSSRMLEDGSYLRLRNINFGYDLPSSFMKKMGIASAKIYISADNLWTLTKFSGIDPETSLLNSSITGESGTNFQQNDRKYPMPRKFYLGLNLTF